MPASLVTLLSICTKVRDVEMGLGVKKLQNKIRGVLLTFQVNDTERSKRVRIRTKGSLGSKQRRRSLSSCKSKVKRANFITNSVSRGSSQG
ncbi:unnamed protein product [Dovyalis caffra]|uniref:Uncharacterized protein n=1 Tax=Dovyalis caffra TaxID=77055 RepID=A0AAV1QPH2_9ROSI|nr:unnamed protein product [Dovyalis caffra]